MEQKKAVKYYLWDITYETIKENDAIDTNIKIYHVVAIDMQKAFDRFRYDVTDVTDVKPNIISAIRVFEISVQK